MPSWVLTLVSVILFMHLLLVWYLAIQRGMRARKAPRAAALPGDRKPLVTVIVPAWKEVGTISGCIRALMEVTYPAYEVIIVAGGPDGSYQHALALCEGNRSFSVIEQQPRGKNAALNQGVQQSTGEILVFLDADTLVTPGWLDALVDRLNKSTPVCTGRAYPLCKTIVSMAEQMEVISAYEIKQQITLQGNATIGMARSVYSAVSGFPEKVRVGVDWDLDIRLADLGIQCGYAPEAVVYTERPATIQEYWKNEVRWRRAHIRSMIQHKHRFFGSVMRGLSSLYIYSLAWFIVATGLLSLMAYFLGHSQWMVLWGVFLAWILLRRAALGGEVAAYTQDWYWLRLTWVSAVLLCVAFMAIITASLSIRINPVHFKGPRSSPAANHEL